MKNEEPWTTSVQRAARSGQAPSSIYAVRCTLHARMNLRRRIDGLSALFDAILFFVIILAATGALFCWASEMTVGTTDDLATRDLGGHAMDVQSSALTCTVGPVNYSARGSDGVFSGSVYDCLRTIIVERNADQNCEIGDLVDAVRSVYGLLVERPFHFGLKASTGGLGPDLFISESVAVNMNPGAVRWTNAVPIIVNGAEGELTLYLWR